MAIPYNTTVTGTSIRDALGRHIRIKHSGTWQSVEDVQIKHSGAWRDTKEVWIKSGGTWRLVHEGEHFLFQAELFSFRCGLDLTNLQMIHGCQTRRPSQMPASQ